MPKKSRRRLLEYKKKHYVSKPSPNYDPVKVLSEENEVSTPRGRLKGALKEALDPGGEESDASAGLLTPMKRNGRRSRSNSSSSSSEAVGGPAGRRGAARGTGGGGGRQQSPQRYVLKLFDRSVDLSQFDEDSPLYPICRAWIANQPRMNYKKFGKKKFKPPRATDESVELPGPTGPPLSRVPELLPEQLAASKDNINLNYVEAPPPAREELVAAHCARWAGVRRAWLARAARVEARYHAAQQLLNRINVSAL